MLKVVFNTTPIISLLKIERLSLLKDLYTEIYIPREVYTELENGQNNEYYTDISKIEWIIIKEIENEKL